jgi:hypothetical protein
MRTGVGLECMIQECHDQPTLRLVPTLLLSPCHMAIWRLGQHGAQRRRIAVEVVVLCIATPTKRHDVLVVGCQVLADSSQYSYGR